MTDKQRHSGRNRGWAYKDKTNVPNTPVGFHLTKSLEKHLDDMSLKDREFAQSLISSFNKKKTLSDKQMYWASKLIDKTT